MPLSIPGRRGFHPRAQLCGYNACLPSSFCYPCPSAVGAVFNRARSVACFQVASTECLLSPCPSPVGAVSNRARAELCASKLRLPNSCCYPYPSPVGAVSNRARAELCASKSRLPSSCCYPYPSPVGAVSNRAFSCVLPNCVYRVPAATLIHPR